MSSVLWICVDLLAGFSSDSEPEDKEGSNGLDLLASMLDAQGNESKEREGVREEEAGERGGAKSAALRVKRPLEGGRGGGNREKRRRKAGDEAERRKDEELSEMKGEGISVIVGHTL